MDMGFVRGSRFSHKHNDGHLVTSLDGHHRQCDTLYIGLPFQTLPIQLIKTFLHTHGATGVQQKFIRTDEG
jgi:hypothetical protein